MAKGEYLSNYQQKVVRGYYENRDTIFVTKLSSIVSDLAITKSEKEVGRLWAKAKEFLAKTTANPARVQKLVGEKNLEELARIVNELANSKGDVSKGPSQTSSSTPASSAGSGATSDIANPTSEISAFPASSTPLLLHSSTSHETPASLITDLTRTLTRKHPTTDARVAALLHYFTPTAKIDHKPLSPEALSPFVRTPLDVQGRTIQADDTTHHERLVLVRQRQPCLIARLVLKRDSQTAQWLITEVATLVNIG